VVLRYCPGGNRFSWGDPVAAQFQNWTGVPRPVPSPRQWPGNPTPLLILNMSCQLDLAHEFDVRRSISWYLAVSRGTMMYVKKRPTVYIYHSYKFNKHNKFNSFAHFGLL